MNKIFYHAISERQNSYALVIDTVFHGYTEDEINSMIVNHDAVKKIEHQSPGRIVIRWKSDVEYADAHENLGYINRPRRELITHLRK